jgi:predicted dehydrogenase
MLRAALVGTGYWGPNLANSIERTGKGVLHYLCDVNPKNLYGLARRYPHAKATTDIEEAIGDPALDAVFISTPTGTHYALGKRVLEAGKHVLIEKP